MFVPIGDLFLKTAKKYHLGPVAEATLVGRTFMKIAEEIFAKVSTSPHLFIPEVQFKKNTLHIQVANSSVAQELFLRSEEIIRMVNKNIGKNVVEKIKIRIS